jgi:hypothetical protein
LRFWPLNKPEGCEPADACLAAGTEASKAEKFPSFCGSAKLQQAIMGDDFLGDGFQDLHNCVRFPSH